jgi:hypothetical protein
LENSVAGYTGEEQITGQAEYGGLQIQVYPMEAEIYEREIKSERLRHREEHYFCAAARPAPIGLAPSGQMRQQIYWDRFGFDVWDRSHSSRCFVHLCNSLVWQSITGQHSPYPPPTAKSYSEAGLPWFDYYRDDVEALALTGQDIPPKGVNRFTKPIYLTVERVHATAQSNDYPGCR